MVFGWGSSEKLEPEPALSGSPTGQELGFGNVGAACWLSPGTPGWCEPVASVSPCKEGIVTLWAGTPSSHSPPSAWWLFTLAALETPNHGPFTLP
jgi:hypothetical protein